jgi:hypothetical protein
MNIKKFYDADPATGGSQESTSIAALMAKEGTMSHSDNMVVTPVGRNEEAKAAEPAPVETTNDGNVTNAEPESPISAKVEEQVQTQVQPQWQEVLRQQQPEAILKELGFNENAVGFLKELKEVDDDNWEVSPRKIAQFMGTEMFRDIIHKLMPNLLESFWIARLNQRITNAYIPEGAGEYDDDDTIVIPDVRFQDEYDWVINKGGIIIHLIRPEYTGNVGIQNHPSESPINLHNQERTYVCLNDSTIQELYKRISTILTLSKY